MRSSSLESTSDVIDLRKDAVIRSRGSFLGIFILVGLALSSASAQEVVAPPAQILDPVAVPRAANANLGPQLKAGDIVSINVFGEPSLTGAFPVGPAGDIVFPLLGSIPAAGLTAGGVGNEIKSRLEADYIRSAQVAVALAEEAKLAPNTITVIGQVMRPGQVAFEQGTPMDLFTAISSAGGLTERANRSRVELKRREGDDLRTRSLDLERDRVLPLLDKDTIIVHAKVETIVAERVIQTVTVIGEVRTPGQIQLKDDQPLDIISAIAMAGGFTPTARPSRVFVRRPIESGGVESFEVNVSKMQKDNSQPFLLEPNDTVTVPQSVF